MSKPVSSALPLFQRLPALAAAVPWRSIGAWPTPVTPARKFAEAHGLASLHLKREDLSHARCGGNKIRGLEFLLAEAERRGAGTIVTFSSAGSHHVCKTAWHARSLGIDTVALVVRQPAAEYVRRNLSAGLAAGATYVPVNYLTLPPKLAWYWMRCRFSRGHRPWMYFPAGGTSPLSCLGHVNAMLELRQQIDAGLLPEPDYLYGALGSLGTLAGLAVGAKLAGLRTRLVGVVVSYRWYCTPGRWARLARRTLRLMRRIDPAVPDLRIDPAELSVVGSALGRGYARFTEAGLRLAEQFHDCEGIRLDGTYTAKALDGALQFIRRRGAANAAHLFWQSYHDMPALSVEQNAPPAALRRYFFADAAAGPSPSVSRAAGANENAGCLGETPGAFRRGE